MVKRFFVYLSRRHQLMVCGEDGIKGFMDKGYHGPLDPRPGEDWEVMVTTHSRDGRIFFWISGPASLGRRSDYGAEIAEFISGSL